jgi:DNA adenine methylase
MDVVKPVLKWVGGKTQIIDRILAHVPKTMHNYHEPFIGGGSVLLGVLTLAKEDAIQIRGKVFASDKNENLIALYSNIQQHPDILINELQELVNVFSNVPDDKISVNRKPSSIEEATQCKEQYYYWARDTYNKMSKVEKISCKGSAYFVFLNKTCFRGLYREGPNGFNVPYGNYKNPSIYDEDHILIVSSLLQDVVLQCQGFDTSLSCVQDGDFVYLDPPYAPETSTSFVGYTADGFGEELHAKLFDLCENMTLMPNVQFVMSNADVKLVRKHFPNNKYCVNVVSCRRAINSKKPQSTTNEVLIIWCSGGVNRSPLQY